jgi:hypothetical protein
VTTVAGNFLSFVPIRQEGGCARIGGFRPSGNQTRFNKKTDTQAENQNGQDR